MVVDLQFLSPLALWLLLLIPILAVLLYSGFKRRSAKVQALGYSPNKIVGHKFPLTIHLALIALLIIAIARPSIGYKETTLKLTSGDFVFLLDISHSMLATDLKPNRLAIAMHKIQDALREIKKTQPGARAGLVLFAGSAYVFCPPTADFAAFKIFLDAVNVDLIDAPGSELLGAIKVTLNMLTAAKSNSADIIVLSDFEESNPDDLALTEELKGSHHRLHLLGFGTSAGSPIRFNSGRFLRDSNGNFVISHLDHKRLAYLGTTLATSSGVSDLANRDLQKIITSSPNLQTQNERSIRIYNEVGPWVLVFVMVGLALMQFRLIPSTLFILLIALNLGYCPELSAESTPGLPALETPARSAAKAYSSGDYQLARDLYAEALKQAPTDKKIMEGLAASEYQLGNYASANQIYDLLNESATSGRERFEASYNSGTTALKAGKLDEAIATLERALKIKPGDIPAETNLTIAKRLKEQQKEKQQEQKDDKQNKDQSEQNKDDQQKKDQSQEPSKDNNDSETTSQDQQQNEDRKQSNKQQQSPEEQPNDEEQSSQEDQKQSDQESNSERPIERQDNANTGQQDNKDEQASEINDQSERKEVKPLAAEQAKAWLESLPDAPVILRRNPGRNLKTDAQTW